MRTKRRKRKSGGKAPRQVDVPSMLLALGIEFRDQHGEYWAPCPHPGHNERTPSWSINDEGAHHCFGCKWQGGAAELVMKKVGLSSYQAAWTYLEERGLYADGPLPLSVRLGIERPDVGDMQMDRDARMRPLAGWVTPAKRYAKERGITAAQVDRWGLGYAAGGFYANRILFPTRSRTGALLNLTGRKWGKGDGPKYLNAKELHGWDPGGIFGEQWWPAHPARTTLVLCEGELNALACERVGAEYVGALGGSQLEKEQVLKLSQFKQVVIATDMDRAGSDVARSLKATLQRWRKCVVAKFPDRRDPNDLEREDPALLRRVLAEAV